ncbi:MAG: cytochrome C [Geobacteraceae bacterium]|nr:cytochrome C [Geobacteraceae bacterium]
MRKIILLAALITLIASTGADARIKVKGRGANMNFDPASLPPQYAETFNMMTKKCSKCHTMERTVIAIQTGRAPITGQIFDRQAVKAYGIKMLRKPNSEMSKPDIRNVVILLNYILDENKR